MRRVFQLLLLSLIMLAPACGKEEPAVPPEESISREAFLDAYVELRVAALRWVRGRIPPEERDRILRERGLTQEDLLRFVELRGKDVEFSKELWTEADERIQALRTQGGEPR